MKSKKSIKGLKCKGFQFKEGETYHEEESLICHKGFHFCENPLDVLNYYDLCESDFAEIESRPGATIDRNNENSKVSTTDIKIKTLLNLTGFIKASVDFLLNTTKSDKKSGDNQKIAGSGYNQNIAGSGYNQQIAGSGDYQVLACIGCNGQIKGKVNSWITLAEYDDNYKIKLVKSAKIDGKKIKEDVYYKLKNGKFIKA